MLRARAWRLSVCLSVYLTAWNIGGLWSHRPPVQQKMEIYTWQNRTVSWLPARRIPPVSNIPWSRILPRKSSEVKFCVQRLARHGISTSAQLLIRNLRNTRKLFYRHVYGCLAHLCALSGPLLTLSTLIKRLLTYPLTYLLASLSRSPYAHVCSLVKSSHLKSSQRDAVEAGAKHLSVRIIPVTTIWK